MRRVVSSSFVDCFAAMLCSPAVAGTIGLSWDAAAGATGYRVYYGESPGNYLPSPLYEGPATSTTVTSQSLAGCTMWHFAVTAYNGAGESGFSTPVSSWPRPEVHHMPITADNVADLCERNPWGLDVSSGIERAPGTKDADAMKRLFSIVTLLRAEATRPRTVIVRRPRATWRT